jgi:hypothetical protein
MTMRSLLRPSPESYSWESLPNEIWLLIVVKLSPIDTCNILFVNRFFRELAKDEPKIWTDQHGVPRSSDSGSIPLYQAWLSKFQSQESRHKDIIFALNSRLSIFSNDDLSIISSVDKLLELVQDGSFNSGKDVIVMAAETAKLRGSTLPASFYIRFEEACVDGAVKQAQNGLFNTGKDGIAMAAETAKLRRSTLPASLYIRFEEACVDGAVKEAQNGLFNTGKDGIAMAAETAKLRRSTLPASLYIRFEEACVDKAS